MGSCATGVLAIVVSLTALDSRVNDSMNEVTNSDGRDPAVAGGRPPTSARIAAPSNQSIGMPIHEGTSRYQGLWLILAIACLAAFVDVVVASRSGLWGDEILSLAKATGHRLDQANHVADPNQGDFVEPDHPVSANEFRRYLRHDHPFAGPGRVIRAVLFSEAHPPLYFLLLYAWTMALATATTPLDFFSSPSFLLFFRSLPIIAGRLGGNEAVLPSAA